ncbi:MAG: ATP-dependent Clp protease ATP-binding subunit [Lachnospiraceae bacterium]|nr:ATP-dependent Clp protease ATP-binding subunit [Lachnospiraceae bacterium]
MKFSSQADKALKTAKKISKDLGHGNVGTEHLLYGLLKAEDSIAYQVLTDESISEKDVLNLISELMHSDGGQAVKERNGYTPKMEKLLILAEEQAKISNSDEVGTEHLLLAMFQCRDCAALRILNSFGANESRIFQGLIHSMGENGKKYSKALAAVIHEKSAGPEASVLDQFSRDMTELAAAGELDPVIGRTVEIQRVVQILSRRTKNNPCLIGEPGVGKTAIVEGIAQKIYSGEVPDSLRGYRLLSLDLSGMVAGTKYRGEFEERIKKVLNEIKNRGNIILFIDEIHTMIGAGGAEGALDASNIMKPALARGEIRVIGATTIDEYRKHIEKDAALERRFQPVMVEEPSEAECIDILKGVKKLYEAHHGVTISDEAVEASVELSSRYVADRFLPDKAIDLMDESASRLRLKNAKVSPRLVELREKLKMSDKTLENIIISGDIDKARKFREETEAEREELKKLEKRLSNKKPGAKDTLKAEHIAEVVAEWTKIPVTRLTQSETNRLMNLEKTLHKRVIGQDEAVKAVAKAVRRGRVGLKAPGRPIGSFLFLGPTGVGKTEITKALAESIFGNESALIRVDMSEYMEKYSVSKMIGSAPGYVGYEEGGQLAEKIRRHPYSVVLFDEIEKAHPDVFNILLQVLDDGHITDSQGRKVDFKNTIIIMTSNAGASAIIEPKHLGFSTDSSEKADYEAMKSGVMDEIKRTFRPEFLNRIDETIVFKPLNKKDLGQIVKLLTKSLKDRLKENFDITLSIGSAANERIVEMGYDPKYGARPLRRVIQTQIEDELSDQLLYGSIKRGDKVSVSVKDKKFVFKPSRSKEK